MEVWKEIKGYEGFYEVSSIGRVRSIRSGVWKILKQTLTGGKYKRVTFCIDYKYCTFRVHQLVAIAFLNHKPCGYRLVVDHINNDKLDNRLSNLQIITQRENTSKNKVGGSSKYLGVHWFKRDKKWASQISIKGQRIRLGMFDCEITAAKAYQDALKNLK